jgi:hypothetical protein
MEEAERKLLSGEKNIIIILLSFCGFRVMESNPCVFADFFSSSSLSPSLERFSFLVILENPFDLLLAF